ncbi:MAG: copper resistance CopC family protein [Gemmatimonadales bacterium]
MISRTAEANAFHLHLKRAEPGVNDTIAVAPKVIRLWFTERPEVAVARIELRGPGGVAIAVARPTIDAGEDAPLTAQVTGTMAPGAYTVLWRAMSADGHAMRGSFGFLFRSGK